MLIVALIYFLKKVWAKHNKGTQVFLKNYNFNSNQTTSENMIYYVKLILVSDLWDRSHDDKQKTRELMKVKLNEVRFWPF